MLLPVSTLLQTDRPNTINSYHYSDRVWPASASRSADLQSLIDNFDENKDLVNPVHLKNFERTISGDEDVTRDSKHCK